jgi:nitrogen-specific signal transduction histidine kinase
MQNVLALVRAIAQAHGGNAEVASTSERTTFKLSLPIAPEAGR